jgi:serine/threonine-protein kinase
MAFAIGLAIMAMLWRGVLVRRTLTFEQLHALDAFYTVGANSIIAFCAIVSSDQRQAAYTCLLYSCFAILTRALIVPSTGTRTAVVSALAIVPMAIGAMIVATADWPGPKDVRAPGFLLGFVQIEVVAILLAAAGSRIIYGLRRQVSAAQQLGQYTLVRKIGEGGMGVVYLAHHIMLRRPTAVKLLLPDRVGAENLERFEREVQHMSQLTHPNTVAVFDYGRSPEGVFYYAMEYLGGGIDLENLVRTHGRQPPERVRQILIQICGALREAHERHLIHRDIKPANIILCVRGATPDVVKVVDFGLVREFTADAGLSAQVVLGTPAYLAPEAITDPNTVGPQADLYAVGCVGHFLLSAQRLFEGKTALDVCIQHVTKAPPRLSEIAGVDVPLALEDLIFQCLSKRPGDRPASAEALADALHAMGPFEGWDDDRATAWWTEIRPGENASPPSAPTMTITVDLGHRGGAGRSLS